MLIPKRIAAGRNQQKRSDGGKQRSPGWIGRAIIYEDESGAYKEYSDRGKGV
jgi:hypothetical protein